MKRRANFTIDSDLLASAKFFAMKHGVSLSQMIEEYFKNLLYASPDLIKKWKGMFKPNPLSKKEGDTLRFKAIYDKHIRCS